MITTPGEMYIGMPFTVLEGKALVEETWRESEYVTRGLMSFFGPSSKSDSLEGQGRVFLVRALQLPMVLAIDAVTQRPIVFDARKLVFRELDKKYVREYVKLFKQPEIKVTIGTTSAAEVFGDDKSE